MHSEKEILLVVFLFALFAPSVDVAAAGYGPHSGYVSDVKMERAIKYRDLEFHFPPERPTEEISLRDQIFDRKLRREFQEEYDRRFGPSHLDPYAGVALAGQSAASATGGFDRQNQLSDRRREFGEFMVRRLIEYHFDHYLREDPKARPILIMKEKLSQTEIGIRHWKLNLSYALSNRTLTVNVVNPWDDHFKLKWEYGNLGWLTDSDRDTSLRVGYEFLGSRELELRYAFAKSFVQALGRVPIGRSWVGTISMSTDVVVLSDEERDVLLAAGASYSF